MTILVLKLVLAQPCFHAGSVGHMSTREPLSSCSTESHTGRSESLISQHRHGVPARTRVPGLKSRNYSSGNRLLPLHTGRPARGGSLVPTRRLPDALEANLEFPARWIEHRPPRIRRGKQRSLHTALALDRGA